MNITVEKQPKCVAALSVEVAAEKVATERASIVKGISGQAKIPGFRPGKVPAKVIEKRFGKQIEAELQERLLQQAIQDAVKQEELNVLDVVQPTDLGFTDEGAFHFKTDVLLQPEFETPDYSSLKVEVEAPEVTEEDVEQSLSALRERYADFNEVDEAAKNGGFVTISYTTTFEGKPLEEATEQPVGFLAKNDDYWVKMDEESFLPGFCAQVEGMKAGDEKDITVTLPEDFPASELRGKEVVVATKVVAVKEQSLPELNDEFAGKVIPDKTMDDLKELIKDSLLEEKNRQLEDEKVDQIVTQLSEGLDFELPERLIESESQNVLRQKLNAAVQSGAAGDEIGTLIESLKEESNSQAEKNLRVHFILQKIAELEKVEVTQEELVGRIQQMAQQQQTPVKKFIKELQEKNQIPGVQSSILIGKTVDFLVAKAEVVESDAKSDEAASDSED